MAAAAVLYAKKDREPPGEVDPFARPRTARGSRRRHRAAPDRCLGDERPGLSGRTAGIAGSQGPLYRAPDPHFPLPMDRIRLVNPGDRITIGERTLTGFKPPAFDNPITTGFHDS